MFRHRPGPIALLAAAAILPAALLETLGSSTVPVGGLEHLLVVGVTALVAAIASAHLTATAVRRRDAQTALLGTAFSTMTSMLGVHALSTPGVLVGPNGVVALAGGLSLPAGAAVLTLSALPGLRSTRRMGLLLALQGVLALGVVSLGAVGLAWPALVPPVPASGSRSALTLMAFGVALFVLLANRAMRTFALTRRADDLVVAVGCAWLAVASVATLTRAPGTAAFYLGHFLEVSGVLLLGVGGLLHDIGKLSVSGEILRKPGKLTDAEYDAVKTHPAAGVELLSELGGFPAPVHALVGEHHERLDGAGYPRGLAAADLEIGPRILAACDVYDALVSDRVYREAWTPERALALLREQTGTAFDGACVESLARVVGLAPATAPAAARAVGAPAIRLA